MTYWFEFRAYNRAFKVPLQTNHGVWRDRSGILLRLTNSLGQVAFGEIAPLPWFGSESFEQAWMFCRQQPNELTEEAIATIPAHLPACQFGFESAQEMLTDPSSTASPRPHSALLPTGADALNHWRSLWEQGYRTFKWKIAVASLSEEVHWFEQLISELPPDANLRLDANGGLNWDEACRWLEVCSDRPQIEFIEQPLPPNQLDGLLNLSDRYPTPPIALDESVATLEQLVTCYERGWRGIFVIKAAIAGSPSRLRHLCQTWDLDVVWSSVFETAIAQHFILNRLIPSVPQRQRAMGFGVNQWFQDALNQPDFEQLWNSLSPIGENASTMIG